MLLVSSNNVISNHSIENTSISKNCSVSILNHLLFNFHANMYCVFIVDRFC